MNVIGSMSSKTPVIGSTTKQPSVGQGGIGQPGGMVPPPTSFGSSFARRPAQPSMAQPRGRPMTRRPGSMLR